jgi:hypothetical protein
MPKSQSKIHIIYLERPIQNRSPGKVSDRNVHQKMFTGRWSSDPDHQSFFWSHSAGEGANSKLETRKPV